MNSASVTPEYRHCHIVGEDLVLGLSEAFIDCRVTSNHAKLGRANFCLASQALFEELSKEDRCIYLVTYIDAFLHYLFC